MYKASVDNWGDTRFIATTRHSSFVMDTQVNGANPVDTLLASLCSCMGHHVREYFAAKGSPLPPFRVAAESASDREAPSIQAISVRIEIGSMALSPQEQAALLAEAERCKIHATLRKACRIDVAVVSGEARANVA